MTMQALTTPAQESVVVSNPARALSPLKLQEVEKGNGLHQLCYGCDLFIDDELHKRREKECIGLGAYIGRCQPAHCNRCLEESLERRKSRREHLKLVKGNHTPVTVSAGANVLNRYVDLGIPIHHYDLSAKGSTETGWPEKAAKGEPLQELLPLVGKKNFGAETGVETPGGFLADFDFDSLKSEVNAAGARFLLKLLPTATFGRKSKPISHAIFFTDKPVGNDEVEKVIELRGTKKDGTLGLQTMVPPSIHPKTKEPLEWCASDFHICATSAEKLQSAYQLTKTLMIILEHTEGKHFDHTTRLAAAAHFLRNFDDRTAIRIMLAIAEERGVDDLDDVRRAVNSTAAKLRNNEAIQVKPFVEWIGPDAAKLLKVDRKSREVVTVQASEIEPRAVRWSWKDRLPLGEVALVTGPVAGGKSTVLLDTGAKLTKGKLPGEFFGQPRDVIIATTEDSWEHTIVPRLMAAGADLKRVHQIGIRVENVGVIELSLPDDVKGLEEKINELQVAMVIIDPLIPKLSRKIDTHKDAEVRQGLEPLIAVTHRTGCSIVGIVHHNKSSTSDPLNVVMGSRAFTATVRSVLTVLVEDETRYLCLPKHNLGKEQPSLTFRISSETVGEEKDGTPITAGKIEWLEESKETAEGIMARKQHGGKRVVRPIDVAREWLIDRLDGEKEPIASKVLKDEALKSGISEATLKRASQDLVQVSIIKGKRDTAWLIPV